MSNFIYTAGLNNVGSYQVSGAPYAIDPSSTPVVFPYVTSWVKIINNGSVDRKVGFSVNGVGGTNYFLVPATSSTEPLPLKLSELHLDSVADITIVAGLTNLSTQRVNNLSGSDDIVGNNWSGSVGVG
jgi:hypothetical protein